MEETSLDIYVHLGEKEIKIILGWYESIVNKLPSFLDVDHDERLLYQKLRELIVREDTHKRRDELFKFISELQTLSRKYGILITNPDCCGENPMLWDSVNNKKLSNFTESNGIYQLRDTP